MNPLSEAELADYPMFPLGTPLLPGTALPMQIFEPRYLEMMRRELDDPRRTQPEFGIVMIERGTETGGDDERATVACRSIAVNLQSPSAGVIRFAAVGVERLRVVRWHEDDPFPRAQVEAWPDLPGPSVDKRRLDAISDLVQELAELGAALGERQVEPIAPTTIDSGYGLFQLAAAAPIGTLDRYRVLAAPTLDERVTALTAALEDAHSVLKFRQIC